MGDHHTGWSKGYGFVSFRSKEEAEAAIREMQGKQLGSRRIRVGWAQHKQDVCATPLTFDEVDRADPHNANVYIGNIAPEASEADLIEHFSVHGAVADVKLHKKGNYGFVRFEAHDSAVKAIVAQHSRKLKGRMLKCSWGKNVSSVRRPAPMQLQGLAATLQVRGEWVFVRCLLDPASSPSSLPPPTLSPALSLPTCQACHAQTSSCPPPPHLSHRASSSRVPPLWLPPPPRSPSPLCPAACSAPPARCPCLSR